MKRIYSISVIAFAILLMQVLTAIPHHHHHDGMICFLMEHMEHHCDQNQTADQRPAPDHTPGEAHCVVHAEFILPHAESVVRINPVTPHHGDEFSFCSDLFVAVLADLWMLAPDKKPDYGEYISPFLITEIRSPLGLRAPPISFS
ncbi:MAG: DUF6769 family protein [Proteiniphilum sp.]|nr:hypothetical protein [Proteiniphilum sp.]MDD3780002.1 hypothetical protein [Proteiniphilum sp.]